VTKTNVLRLVANAATRFRDPTFLSWFGLGSTKHNHYQDFGFPEAVQFAQFFHAYTRNGLARAGVDKTVAKTWEDNPWLLEKERDGSQGQTSDETPLEREIRRRFDDLRLWQHLAEADRRGLVGAYGGVILRFADDQPFEQPVTRVPGGLDGLVEVIPAWQGQLTVSSWVEDQRAPDYGRPAMFQFNESAVGNPQGQVRSFNVHPDRVLVWSRDGTVHGRSFLEPGFNDLLTMEKIVGAGGEGFWKNAKSAPILEIDKEASLEQMAKNMGRKPDEVREVMEEQVAEWQRGFDQLLMLQGMQAKTLGVTLPSPEHFFAIALQSFAASVQCPLKILIGSQTGERASTEDAEEWAKVNMARRRGIAVPNIREMVARFVRFGILPERDWFVDWADLTESSMADKIARADKMADVNQKMGAAGELVFTPEEIRAAVDLEPLSEADRYREPSGQDERAAMGLPDDAAETQDKGATA